MDINNHNSYRHAQLGENNAVIAMSELAGKVEAPNMVLIDELPEELRNKIDIGWRLIDGEWLEPVPEPEPEPPLYSKEDYELANTKLLLEIVDKLYSIEEDK